MPIREMLILPGTLKTLRRKEAHSMHDIVIAIIFVAMVLAPCITAARSGAAEAEENL